MQQTLHMAFVTAYLLTENTNRSEAVVLEAIGSWEPSDGTKALLATAAEIALESNGSHSDELPLPLALRSLLHLSRQDRRCVVLRILLGLPLQECARLLQMKARELNDRTCAALAQWASFATQNPGMETFANEQTER